MSHMGMGIMSGPSFKSKRQRLAFTCDSCRKRKIKCDKAKPKCSTCARLGKPCNYAIPHWTNTHVESFTVIDKEQDPAPRSRAELLKEIQYWKSKAEESSPVSIPDGSIDTSKVEHDVISDLSTPKEPLTNTMDPSMSPFDFHGSDIIDLHEAQYSSYINEYNNEQYPPLHPMSIHKSDHYMEFFLCIKYLIQCMLRRTFNDLPNAQPLHDVSKWVILFDARPKDHLITKSIFNLVKDRDQMTSSTKLIGAHYPQETTLHSVVSEVEMLLPSEASLYALLDHFFNYIWPLRPVVDKKAFLLNMKRLIHYDGDRQQARVIWEKKQDMISLAKLLIILRYASISISLVDDIDLKSNLLVLKGNPIPVRAVSIAYMCLSVLTSREKRTVQLVQALILFLFYYKDRPEESISSGFTEYQSHFALLVQTALVIGLNKDPTYFGLSTENYNGNLRRRLWFTILALDTEAVALSGSISTLPASTTINVGFPVMSFKTPLEQAEIEELTKDVQLGNIYTSLGETINDLNVNPTLSKMIELLNSAESFVNQHYSLSKLSNITKFEVDSELYKASSYKNHKIMEKNITLCSAKLTIYHHLCIHYEDNKYANLIMFKTLHQRYIQTLFESMDLTGGLMSNTFRSYLDPLHSTFAILPFLTNLCSKIANAMQSFFLNVYHAQDLLICGLYTSTSGVERSYYNSMAQVLLNVTDSYMEILKKSIGFKTFAALKIVCTMNIYVYYFKSKKFSALTKFNNFFDGFDNDNISDEQFWDNAKKIEQKKESSSSPIQNGFFSAHSQWLRLSSSYRMAVNNVIEPHKRAHFRFCTSIVNVNHINQLAELTKLEIDQMKAVFTQPAKHCPQLNMNALNPEETPTDTKLRAILEEAMEAFSLESSFGELVNLVLDGGESSLKAFPDPSIDNIEDLDVIMS